MCCWLGYSVALRDGNTEVDLLGKTYFATLWESIKCTLTRILRNRYVRRVPASLKSSASALFYMLDLIVGTTVTQLGNLKVMGWIRSWSSTTQPLRIGGCNYNSQQRQNNDQNRPTHVDLCHWLINYSIPKLKQISHLNFILDLYDQKNFWAAEQNLITTNFRPWAIYRPTLPWVKGRSGTLWKDPHVLWKSYIVNLSSFFKGTYVWFFARVTHTLGKGNDQIIQGLLYIDSVWAVIPGDTKHHCGLPVRVVACGGLVINRVSAKVCLTCVA